MQELFTVWQAKEETQTEGKTRKEKRKKESKSHPHPSNARLSSIYIEFEQLPRPALLVMYPPHVVPHIVHPAEDARASFPAAVDAGVVLGFVTAAVLAAGEAAGRGLGAAGVPAEEVSAVALVVLAQVAATVEDGFGAAARVGAAPGPGPRWGAVVRDVVGLLQWRWRGAVALAWLRGRGWVRVSRPWDHVVDSHGDVVVCGQLGEGWDG